MKDFKFSVPDKAVLPDTETNGGLTLAPKEFQVQISSIWITILFVPQKN